MVAVTVYTCMVSGLRGRIPKRDAHIYIHTLSENSVPIMCLALRRSAIKLVQPTRQGVNRIKNLSELYVIHVYIGLVQLYVK